jgi:hypothetical protein
MWSGFCRALSRDPVHSPEPDQSGKTAPDSLPWHHASIVIALRLGGWGGRRLLQRCQHSLRDSQPVRQSREGAGGGIAETAERCEQRWQQNMDPLVGFALAHAEQSPLDHLNGVGLQVGEQEEQPIFRR